MKFRIFAVMSVVAITLFAFVACNQNKVPPVTQQPEPEYFDMEVESFLTEMKDLMSLENYMTAAGYTFSLDVTQSAEQITAEGKLDLSDFQNISLSANAKSVASAPPASSSGENKPSGSDSPMVGTKSIAAKKIETYYNIYVSDRALYVDKTASGKVERDKVENFEVGMLSLLDLDLDNFGELANNLLGGDYADLFGSLSDDYFKQFMSIKHCPETGNYKYVLDHSVSGLNDGKVVMPFKIELDFYASNRIVELSGSFRSTDLIVKFGFEEQPVVIDLPEDLSLYDGGYILDKFEEYYVNRSVKFGDFEGEWTDEQGKYNVTVTKDELTLTVDGVPVEYTKLDRLFHVITLSGDGFTYYLKLNVAEDVLVLDMPASVVRLTKDNS